MKKHIKLILRTLFSNNACVEAARTKEKKYNIIAIVFALFALFFASLPTCVTGFQQQGGNCIRGTTYAFENGMAQLKEDMSNVGASMQIVDNKGHKLVATNWDAMEPYDWGDGGGQKQDNLHCCIATMPNQEEPGKTHKVLEVYYCDEESCSFSLFVEEIAKNINPIGITKENKAFEEKNAERYLERKSNGDGDNFDLVTRTTSFIVFGKTQVQLAICPPGTSTIASSVYGDYAYVPVTSDFITSLVPSITSNPSDILNNCRTFFDRVYVNPRRANTWKSTGIILGVDAGVILLMGLMVWILTRGKNNPFRIYSFWDGQKIAYYASLTPGILSLFGFLMSNMAMMLFILGVGVRVMWLSMRTLRYQAPAKQ